MVKENKEKMLEHKRKDGYDEMEHKCEKENEEET